MTCTPHAGWAGFTPKQAEALLLLQSAARHIMLYGGSRSGKTFLLLVAIVVRALKAPGSRHAVFRLRFNAVKTSVVFDTFPKVMGLCFPGLAWKLNRSDWFVTLPNGSTIWFCGLDDKERTEKILGQEYATVYFNECSQITYSAVLMALTRLAQKTTLALKAYYDCNPPGTAHWTAVQFVSKRNPGEKGKPPLASPDNYAAMVLNPADNRANIAAEYLEELDALPERQRKRFALGQFVADLDNALWTYDMIRHVPGDPHDLAANCQRILVSVDPSGAAGPEDKRSDEIGISVAGIQPDGRYVVLADRTLRAGPSAWARAAIRAYHEFRADKIVAESNFGGAMVASTISNEDRSVPVEVVHHSRGKVVRAEPISALYAKGEVDHVRPLDERGQVRSAEALEDLEEQMVNMTTAGYVGEKSPDRLDAMVWALSELSLGKRVTYLGMV